MRQRDRFLLLLALASLPIGKAVAEESVGISSSPIQQEVRQSSVRITGTVVDAQGEPVIGASVMEKGTNNGVITDIDGNFILNVSAGSTLQISYVGFVTQEFAIGSQRTFQVVLKEDTEMLDEVVVIGYGSVKKSDLTGSVASVDTEDLIRGGRTDAVGAMQGVLPGVQIQRSNNKPGGEYNILIRGLNTISGSTSPLVVVDGVIGASLSNLNPDDIESFQVLKDVSATSLYGAQAMNGVIVITTKSGRKGAVSVNYAGTVSIRQRPNYGDFNIMNSVDEMSVYKELVKKHF